MRANTNRFKILIPSKPATKTANQPMHLSASAVFNYVRLPAVYKAVVDKSIKIFL